MSSRTLQWLSLVGIIWLQSINGTNSNFPAYSSQLKNLLSISQVQLNNLAFASDAGKLLGWLSGVAVIYLPLWLVLIIGSSLGLLGYGLQYLFLANHISLSYEHILVLTVVAGNSICWINTVCYVVAIRNFPSDQQVAVGITTSYLGLSAKIYTDTVYAVFSNSPVERAKGYLLLSSILPVVASFIVAPLTREVEVGRPRNMGVGFMAMFVITIATGVYSVISSVESISGKISPLGHAIGIGVFLFAPLAIPVADKIIELVRKCNVNKENKVHHFTTEESIEGTAERMEIEVKDNRGAEVADEFRIESEGTTAAGTMEISGVTDQSGDQVGEVRVKEEIGVKVMLKRFEFWLYVFVYFFGATLGLVFLNNLGQIAESRGYSGTSSLVSMSSSFGFFGRLMPSLVDFYLSRTKYTISSPASIVALMAPTAVAFFLLVSKTNLALHVSTAIIGVCCGAITSVAVSTTTELFGKKNFSVNHNVVVANIPIGSFVFGYLAAILYSKEGNGDGKCMGVECYRNTFIIWGSLCFLGTFLAVILYARARKLYLQNVQVLHVNFA